ncbi:LamG domain-containing protein [Candidatus Pacearchaeota archaeon]|nr:LamG domain-containing protein [Candidatus Pacearchaeota archaeon]
MDKKARSLIIKLFLSCLAGIIIFSVIGGILALESDNIKEYNSETKTVTISDGNLLEIAKITLNTPINNHVIRGKDRKVIEFTIESFEDYDDVFNNLEFYDIKNNMQKFNRNFVYKYKDYYDVEVDDYEETCKERERDDGNGTYIEYYDCNKNKIGNHIETRFTWNDFNEKSLLPKGIITLGIFTDVLPNEKIEWIPTLFNIEISEWATWEESLDTGLVTYYKFNEETGNIAEDFINDNDLFSTSTNWTTGILDDNGLSFVPQNLTNKAINETFFRGEQSDFTVSYWFKLDDWYNLTSGSHAGLWSGPSYNLDDRADNFIDSGTGRMRFSYEGDGVGHTNLDGKTTQWNKNVWYHVVIRWSVTDNNVSMFVNNITENSASVNEGYQGTPANHNFTIGNAWLITSLNGTIDEFGIWNRSLSNQEISNLYNSGVGITPSEDNLPPNVIINTPTNDTSPSSSIDFNVTALDDTAMDSCWVTIDSGVSNLTLTNTTNVDDYTGTNSSVPDGGYQAQFYCNDGSNNVNNTETQDFTINTPPTIPTLLAPENETGSAMDSTITFVWDNSTDASGETITYDLEIYNESDMAVENLIHSNISIAEGAVNTSINIKLSDYITVDDDYYWRVRANDSVRASDWSETRHFQYANWTITFNLTDSYTGVQIDTGPGLPNIYSISCANGFSDTNLENHYIATDFGVGIVECTFIMDSGYLIETLNLTIDSDKTIEIPMSESEGLTQEEHTWLEAIYDCIIGGDCNLYNLLLEINSTVGNIWEHTAPTDESVITFENITNKVVDANNNLTIDYTVNIPIKAGYSIGAYLPVRIGFWFLNESNTTCYNQGDKPTGVDEPYCQPLIVETIGPMGGSVDFTVELQPSLPAGNYNIKRIIDIDPLGVWYNYGQETIGSFLVTEALIDSNIDLEKTGEDMLNTGSEQSSSSDDSTSSSSSGGSSRKTIIIINEREIITFVPQTSEDGDETEEVINLNKPSITGATIGALLTSNSLIAIITILSITFIIFLVVTSRTIIKTSENK